MKPTKPEKALKAYRNPEFINGPDARPLRMMAEYLEPAARLRQHGVEDTIVFFGSARLREGNRYYEAARAVARHMTQWSKGLDPEGLRRFVVCTGGGPGIMEAANRGASEARGLNVGFTIALPHEEAPNPYITRDLLFRFHYFFMRKFWLAYLAKALLVFPGGFGTLDELFEVLTLKQTGRMNKPMPILLFGSDYWNEVVNFDAMVRHGTIDAADLNLVHRTDSVEEACAWLVRRLLDDALARPGAML
jgi:uncharacterized protein (TIGR00730 family)